MGRNERIFHAVVFEIIALLMMVPLAAWFSGKGTGDMALVSIILSVTATVWNYIYNVYFDRWFGGERIQRGLMMRISHTLGFEGGLLLITIPFVGWFLQMSLLETLALEAVFITFFLFYTLGFNWLYDKYQPYRALAKWLKIGKRVETKRISS